MDTFYTSSFESPATPPRRTRVARPLHPINRNRNEKLMNTARPVAPASAASREPMHARLRFDRVDEIGRGYGRCSQRLFLLVSIGAALVVAHPRAQAESFGGFSSDQTRYLVDRDQICSPLRISEAPSDQIPSCQRADAQRVAAFGFRRGIKQQGSQASYAAVSRNTLLTIRALPGTGRIAQIVVTWRATDPISRVTGLYLSQGGKLIAAEYESRFGGRVRTRVVGFVLDAADPRPADRSSPPNASPGDHPAGDTPGNRAGPSNRAGQAAPALSKELERALERARRLSQNGKSKAAMAAYRRVLDEDPGHSEARYGVAYNLARQRKFKQAVAELRTLADSTRTDAIIWLIEARFDRIFTRLRGDQEFRRVTGLNRGPSHKARTLYERLVGFTRTWEQAEVKCEQAQINVGFTRLERKFTLRVTSRCGGYKDVTRLRGTWTIKGADQLDLTLPNKRGPDETISCLMQICTDGSNEDCLVCGVDSDLSFTARPVRR